MLSINELFQTQLSVVNIGVESFYEAMQLQQVPTAHVAWRPVAGGDAELQSILDKLNEL